MLLRICRTDSLSGHTLLSLHHWRLCRVNLGQCLNESWCSVSATKSFKSLDLPLLLLSLFLFDLTLNLYLWFSLCLLLTLGLWCIRLWPAEKHLIVIILVEIYHFREQMLAALLILLWRPRKLNGSMAYTG